MSSVRALLAILVATALLAAGPMSTTSLEPLAIGTLVRSSFTASNHSVVRVQAAVFPRDAVTIRIVDVPLGGPDGQRVARAFSPEVVAAVTGGYFGPKYRPHGLLEIGGKVHDPPRADLSGVVGSLADDTPVVAPAADVPADGLRDAIQAGPFIVDPGGAFGIRGDDRQHGRRAIVLLSADKIGVALTSSCTLYELAQGLTQSPTAFGVERVERALNLSGGPSAGIAYRLASGHVEGEPEQIRIRAVVTIRTRPGAAP